MKKRKATVITIDPETKAATITAADGHQIRYYRQIAKSRPHWRIVSAETDKRGKVTSVQYSLPASDIRFKSSLSAEELQRKQEAAASARQHQKRHDYTC